MKVTIEGQQKSRGSEEKQIRKASHVGLSTLGNRQLSGLLTEQGNGAEYARRYLVNGINRRAPADARRPPATAANTFPARPHAGRVLAQPEAVKYGPGLNKTPASWPCNAW